jgi:uncharacterized protein (TIGR03437 family)
MSLQGAAISLSGDGKTAIVGGYGDNLEEGAVWVFGIPDLRIAKSHTGNFRQGDTGAYSISVSNAGTAPTGGPISVTDRLPGSLTPLALSGAGWICTLAQAACVRDDPLAIGASFPPISLTVRAAAGAPPGLTNTAVVSGGSDLSAENNIATDTVTVAPMPDLTIAMTHTGRFLQGELGRPYAITVRNAGGTATAGSVRVAATLPAGLTAQTISGPGWTCEADALACERTDSLVSGGAYAPITLMVDVSTDCSALVTSRASVSGGGEINLTNNAASDPTSVSVIAASSVVNAAGYQKSNLAPEALVTIFGSNLALEAHSGDLESELETLGGTSVTITDAAGVVRASKLAYVSPSQINLLTPAILTPGAGRLTVTNRLGAKVSIPVQAGPVGPGLFSATQNGRGVAAANVVRAGPDGSVVTTPAAVCSGAPPRCAPEPIDMSDPATDVYLVLYGTGIRGHFSLSDVRVSIAGTPVEAIYAGPQPQYPGLDQINVKIPRSLAGRGEADIRVLVSDQQANAVTVTIR